MRLIQPEPLFFEPTEIETSRSEQIYILLNEKEMTLVELIDKTGLSRATILRGIDDLFKKSIIIKSQSRPVRYSKSKKAN